MQSKEYKVSEVTSISGIFVFKNTSENLTVLKKYVVKAKLKEGIRTGDRCTASLVRIETEDGNGDRYEIRPLTPLLGNEFVTTASILEVRTGTLTSQQLTNGENKVGSDTLIMRGGNGTIAQISRSIVIADNGHDSTIDIRNLRVRVNGVFLAQEKVFFSKRNGNDATIYTESDTEIFITFLGGLLLLKDMNVLVELFGTVRGIEIGDAIASKLMTDDPLDLLRRTLSRAQRQHIGRLHTSATLSDNGIVYKVIVSDRSSPNTNANMGIASIDFSNGYFVDESKIKTIIIQKL
jgi:hypothetical protein